MPQYIYIHLGFSIFNLIIAIIGMASVRLTGARELDYRDFWATVLLLVFGPFGTGFLILTAIIQTINKIQPKVKIHKKNKRA